MSELKINSYDIAVIGGGASGLAAAIEAARGKNAPHVAVFERLPRVGKKLLVTGNGRCNLSNYGVAASEYSSPDFVAPALERFGVENTLSFFRSLGVLTLSDAQGRLYPMSGSAASVLDALRFEAQRLGVVFCCSEAVTDISRSDSGFLLNGVHRARAVIAAAGGKASPSHGSDGSGYALMRSLGHSITPLYPALVQLVTEAELPRRLKGIRVNAEIALFSEDAELVRSRGELLFTEYGLSGIAAMETAKAAAQTLANGGKCEARLDLLPSLTVREAADFFLELLSAHPDLPTGELFSGILPRRVGEEALKLAGIGETRQKNSRGGCFAVAEALKSFSLKVVGTKGFANAQVTSGGVALEEINAETTESKKVPALYICGELADIDAGCGGFNLQWAWSSGRLAGQSASLGLTKSKGKQLNAEN